MKQRVLDMCKCLIVNIMSIFNVEQSTKLGFCKACYKLKFKFDHNSFIILVMVSKVLLIIRNDISIKH